MFFVVHCAVTWKWSDHLNLCFSACHGLAQIFIKDGINEGEDLELDELNNSGSSQKQRPQPQCALADTPATSHQLLMPNKANASPTSSPPTPPEDGQKAEKNGDPSKEALGDPAPVVAKAFQTQALPNGKTQTSVKTLSKRKISQQKEKKATQMLAIVLGKPVLSSLRHQFLMRLHTWKLRGEKEWRIHCIARCFLHFSLGKCECHRYHYLNGVHKM